MGDLKSGDVTKSSCSEHFVCNHRGVSDFWSVLQSINALGTSTTERGRTFEQMVRAFLLTDPVWSSRFSEVWFWSDWPDRPTGWTDTGIDLVALEADGGFCAIQCKFYEEDATIDVDAIAHFLASSQQKAQFVFTSRLVVSTTDKWSKKANQLCEKQDPPVARLSASEMALAAIDWSTYDFSDPMRLQRTERNTLRPHQKKAIDAIKVGFEDHDRGKLIMACGTGKTFTSLRLAEETVPDEGTVLFLVPSISLLGQSLAEWVGETERPTAAFAVCSDAQVTKQSEDMHTYDLALPATTNPEILASHFENARKRLAGQKDRLFVIFSTYQSIDQVIAAQGAGVPAFDLVIADEAHRTAGATLAGEEGSHFLRIHEADKLKASRRLFMTATPKIYTEAAKKKAGELDVVLASMDDEAVFGPEFHRLGFGEAVEAGLLSDYRVVILTVDQDYASRLAHDVLASHSHDLPLDDAARLVGCWRGLSKMFEDDGTGTGEVWSDDPMPSRRAVMFANSIATSELMAESFAAVAKAAGAEVGAGVEIETRHVDGTMGATERAAALSWLRGEPSANECRVVTNARCLTEGIDVPALDSVLFLQPRKSQIDVVQAVGRIMRKAQGKKYGYVILPVVIPSDQSPEEVLDHGTAYDVVWQVLQALRAHDERFDAWVNRLDLTSGKNPRVRHVGVGTGDSDDDDVDVTIQKLPLEGLSGAVLAKIVKKCGSRRYWQQWAGDIAQIAEAHASRIRTAVEAPGSPVAVEFARFLESLHDSINDEITESDAIEMLAQHLVTRPVFEALFDKHDFVDQNPVSRAMDGVVAALREHEAIDTETGVLDQFYVSVRRRAQGVDTLAGRQTLVRELYETFFREAFRRTTDRLGIVYTPVELVDFINRSVDQLLKDQFGKTLASQGVHIVDPFVGTGTFLVRMIDEGLLGSGDQLASKFTSELHANEIVLLAYYIGAVNIEQAYQVSSGGTYAPFPGMVLTDTFELTERDQDQLPGFLKDNDARAKRQMDLPITVIVANPPYRFGQKSQNEAAQNLSYPKLDSRIAGTYAALSNAQLKQNLYDSYVRAIRWASDRVGEQGVIGFVTNGSWLRGQAAAGIRASFEKEFNHAFVLDLRGDARTSGELRQREGGNVFGQGSRVPVTIMILVKGVSAVPCEIHYCDIGDYLNREEKLKRVADWTAVTDVPWVEIQSDKYHDWLDQRDDEWDSLFPFEDGVFNLNSNGLVTGRDAWVYNSDKSVLESSVKKMINTFRDEQKKFTTTRAGDPEATVEKVVTNDPTKISWTVNLKKLLEKNGELPYEESSIRPALYRPFFEQWLYFDRNLNERTNQLSKIFGPDVNNRCIIVSGRSAKTFSALATDIVPNFHTLDTARVFPRHVLLDRPDGSFDLDEGLEDNISDGALSLLSTAYPESDVTKDRIFSYLYGLLYHPGYRSKHGSALTKDLPRVSFAEDFDEVADCGSTLMEFHVNYKTVKPYPLEHVKEAAGAQSFLAIDMDFPSLPGSSGHGKNTWDRSRIIVNPTLVLAGIPQEAWAYELNGRPVLELVAERLRPRVDSASGIENDPNRLSPEPGYVIDLFCRVVRVAVDTVALMKRLDGIPLRP